MPKQNVQLIAFNRGIISPLALSRVDLEKRANFSAEIQTNWLPRALGSMMLRPGTQYLGNSQSNAFAQYIPFIFASDDTAIIEMTDSTMRVRINEALITRVSVSTATTNGNFDTDLTGWANADQAGATSAWATGGYMSLVGTSTNAAIRTQTLTVSSGDHNKEHALNLVVSRGPVTLRVGSTSGADDYIKETALGTGIHSLAFTPTTNAYVRISNTRQDASLVSSINIASAGVMAIATPYSVDDIANIRHDQSNDVIYLACYGIQQHKIERRATNSWSMVVYEPEDGPFRLPNFTPITFTPSAITGDITLTASAAFFRSTHVGALFRITSVGQTVSKSFTAEDQYSDPIRVIGAGASQRTFSITLTGTWAATVTLQRSAGDTSSWVDVTTYTGNTSTNYNDALDNQVMYYRLAVKPGNYTSGTPATSLVYTSGGIVGIVRITVFSSSTSVSARVIVPLGAATASSAWSEGAWSDYRGYPSATVLFEGRLWWAGIGKLWGSVSDVFESFDDTVTGDSGTILRTLGSGPIDNVNWLLPLQRLIIGTQGAEKSVRSSSFDQPLTPTDCAIKNAATQGSAAVAGVVIDSRGIFIQKCGTRIYELSYNAGGTYTAFDYGTTDLSLLSPETGLPGFTRLAIQRQVDTRLHVVRSDGLGVVLLSDPVEDVKCTILVQTDGIIEDIFVMPGDVEDKIYWSVQRTINGSTVRFLERMSLESECQGGTLNKQADAYIIYNGSPTSTITGLSHLEGATVVCWGDGADQGTFTVSSGSITLPVSVSQACVGLGYTAQYKSTKLAYAAGGGSALTQRKRVDHLGLNLINTHAKGLQYGPDFDNLDPLPDIEDGAQVDANYLWEQYDKDSIEFPGIIDTDSRVCLQASAPRPCTVTALIVGMETNDKL